MFENKRDRSQKELFSKIFFTVIGFLFIIIIFFCLDLFVGIIIVTRDIIEKSCIPFGLGSIGCRLTSFIQVFVLFLFHRIVRNCDLCLGS